ncbi:MAG: flagellar basal body P-ring formation protein FlgA [Nitrospinae bacterium]|nr:flagellar basal body P-ring formation protein FlgA [Nitrospinota bacterium]
MKQLFNLNRNLFITFALLRFLLIPITAEGVGNSMEQRFSLVISIPATVAVTNKLVHLGDIALIEGKDSALIEQLKTVFICQSPAMGEKRKISKKGVYQIIASKLPQGNSVKVNMPNIVTIGVASKEIRKEVINQKIEDYLHGLFTRDGTELEILNIKIPYAIYVPLEDEAVIVISHNNNQRNGRIYLTLKVYGNNKLISTHRILAEMRLTARGVVPTKDIPSKRVIDYDDVRVESINVSNSHGPIYSDITDVVGKYSTRALRANQPIKEGSLKRVPVVNRGSSVSIIAESSIFKITVPGIAQESGFLNQTIRVLNTNSNKIVFGKIVDSEKISVSF